MPSAHHFSPGNNVWVIAGHHSNRQSAEHAAKVVRCNLLPSSSSSPSCNNEIMIEWHTTGTAEVVSVDRVRPMYGDDNSNDADDTSRAEPCSKSSQPTRKSRRASKQPDRYDNCFANSKYQSMSVASLRKKCIAMGIDVKGCAKGDMVARVVQKEEKERWRRDDGKGETSESTSMETIEESVAGNANDTTDKAWKRPKPKKKKRSGKAAKTTAKAVEKSPMKENGTLTPRKAHLSQRLCAIFSPTRPNAQPATKPRRISEIRRRRNDMEERVRTKLLTARKKSREDIETSAVAIQQDDVGGDNDLNNVESCKRLFCNALEDSNTTSSDHSSTDSSSRVDLTPATVCYPMPNSPSTISVDQTQIQSTAAEGAVQIHFHNPDFIQILYGQLHLAKADYIQSLQALQQMKSNDGYEADDIVELESWRSESRANVHKLRTMLNKALEESTESPA